MQQILVTGHLGKDAVVKQTNGGTEKVIFSVCNTERYKQENDEVKEESTWFNCIYRGKGLAPYLKKGTKVLIQGRLKVSVYKNDRNEHVSDLLVFVDTVEIQNTPKKDN
ncbi:single-stranded DNA-binding protein [Runella limosa]|uniref:single-stranded DNA-binding protein n=1 Tax=Runella limosa TaxID=370978 RepID=UPI0004064D7F|nr:single-stranded DNA-binding protein [Runella limosa]